MNAMTKTIETTMTPEQINAENAQSVLAALNELARTYEEYTAHRNAHPGQPELLFPARFIALLQSTTTVFGEGLEHFNLHK